MPLLRRKNAVQEKGNCNKSQGKMSYTAAIEVKNPALLKLLAVEYKKVKKDRFDVSVDRNVQISAKDATAFKAILNSVANSIQVFEKMEKIK